MSQTIKYFVRRESTKGKTEASTLKSYNYGAAQFENWAKPKGFTVSKIKQDPVSVIQAYANDLTKQGLSPSTVHTRLAPVTSAFGISMKEIKKPKRSAGVLSRSGVDREGRKLNNKQGEREATLPKFDRLVTFQKSVGIRRREIKKLSSDCLRQDENGYLCVEVKKGKGGKHQLQRIKPEHEDEIRAIVSSAEGDKLFSSSELNNKIDLHGIRQQTAKDMYWYYANRLASEPGYRGQLIQEMKDRWVTEKGYNDDGYKCFADELHRTEYKMRGEVRINAESHGMPSVLDRTAVMAVSVFHLSHWRSDVTIKHYLAR